MAVVQLVEQQIVVLHVMGSSPIGHPYNLWYTQGIQKETTMNLRFEVTERLSRYITCKSFSPENEQVSMCKINVNVINDKVRWEISEFFTEKKFMHQGFGKVTMRHLVQCLINKLGNPSSVEYIWNGANSYVLDWITEEFGAVCQCPIAVQKTQSDDDWSSHIYTLDKDRVLNYFK